MDQKVNQQQNTVCLEQQIYAGPENFTPTLLVMLETFRRSGHLAKPLTFQMSHLAALEEAFSAQEKKGMDYVAG